MNMWGIHGDLGRRHLSSKGIFDKISKDREQRMIGAGAVIASGLYDFVLLQVFSSSFVKKTIFFFKNIRKYGMMRILKESSI